MVDHKWKKRFIELAKHVSEWSQDPSTQVGSVIVRPNKSIASLGFNGFPQGVEDTKERYLDREMKLKLMVHAEQNAILFANESLIGYTIFTYPLFPCSICAGFIIQSGITRVISPSSTYGKYRMPNTRWDESNKLAKSMFDECGVSYEELI